MQLPAQGETQININVGVNIVCCRPRAEMVSFEEDIDEEMVPMHHLSAGQRVAMMTSYHSSNGQMMETGSQSAEWFV